VHYSSGGVQPQATRLGNTVQTTEKWNLGPHKGAGPLRVKACPTTIALFGEGKTDREGPNSSQEVKHRLHTVGTLLFFGRHKRLHQVNRGLGQSAEQLGGVTVRL
jgi:hypothetical protein